jgi:hypothetical protein
LKDAGGLLDEVVFIINTDEEEDLAYLEELLPTSPRYSKHQKDPKYPDFWNGLWSVAKDPKAIYMKIDDDIVCICFTPFLPEALRPNKSARFSWKIKPFLPSLNACLRTPATSLYPQMWSTTLPLPGCISAWVYMNLSTRCVTPLATYA